MAEQVDPDMYTIPFQLTKTMHRDPYADILPASHSQKGKIVIITGAYGGIGAAAASVWARAGAFGIVLAGRKPDELAKVEKDVKASATEPTAQVISVRVDIKIESEVQNLYTQIEKVFGRPADVLINNAGSGGEPYLLGLQPWDDFNNIVDSHFKGAVLMAKYFINSQADPSDPVGTIVYITSGISALILPGFGTYSVAKLAGHRMVEYLDAEYPHLRAFTLSPGIIKTRLTNPAFEHFAKDHVDLPGLMSVYLSEERANYLKGAFVGINWDIKEMEQHQEEIKEQKLLKLQFVPAQFGIDGHPWKGAK